MNISEEIKQIIQKAAASIGESSNIEVSDIPLEHPAEMSHGDYSSNIALRESKKHNMSPREYGEKIAQAITDMNVPFIERVEIAGPGFLNFFLSPNYYAEEVKKACAEKTNYGSNQSLAGQTWVIEHSSPNPNKAMHIGHLRNNLVGMALGKLAEKNGAKVILDMIDNNRGIAIAKLMWGYLKFARKDGSIEHTDIAYWYDHQDEWQTPEENNELPDHFVDHLYVSGSQDFGASQDSQTIVRKMVVDWEAKDEKVWALWKHVIAYSYAGQQIIFDRLGSHLDYVWHEHEIYEQGKDLVQEGLKKGILKQLPDGAILTDLAAYDIPDTIVQKSDGTSLYITQDLALTQLKKEKYNADKLFWVIGPEQSLALKQLFAVCEQLGIGKVSDFTHIAYGFMGLKDEAGNLKKMSSRAGTTLFIDDLLDTTKEHLRTKLAATSRSQTVTEESLEDITLAAVKFSILRVGRLQDMAFDIDSSIDFEGDSGPYLQYTYARCQSLLAKAQEHNLAPKAVLPTHWTTTDVERHLPRYGEIVEHALAETAPQYVATYLVELTRAFNSWYGNEKVIDEEQKEISEYKLALVEAVAVVLKNGLEVLGITYIERM